MSYAPHPPLDPVIVEHLEQIERSLAAIRERLKPSGPPDGLRPLKLISVGAAGLLANLSDDRIRALCREHPYPGGFGFRRGGRWQVAEMEFRSFVFATRV